MSSKTPQFDAAMNAYFSKLRPGTRSCPETNESYELSARDIEVYKKFQVPPSKLVPWARIRRLRASIGGYDLFKRSLPDGREVITLYDPESPISVLPTNEWLTKRNNDEFLNVGKSYDSSKMFFPQWQELSARVPRPAIMQDAKNENSDWSSFCLASKNAYQCYTVAESHDVTYCNYVNQTSFCSDMFGCDQNEWCYQGMRLDKCSHVIFSEWCVGCVDSAFLLSCQNCNNCFGCASLSHKSYCFLNEQLTPEEYKKRMSEIDLGDAKVLEYWRNRIMTEVWDRAYRSAVLNRDVENNEGDDNIECKDVVGSGLLQAERQLNALTVIFSKDGADLVSCYKGDWSINSTQTQNGYGYKMSTSCDECMNVEYSELLQGCENCFGCVGLYKKSFCIFNKQYTEEEYYKTVDQLKTKMLVDGEYGEFFPYAVFPIAYNTSHADVLCPQTKEEIARLGGRWYEQPLNEIPGALPIEALPDKLSETTNEILKLAYRCPITGRAFRFVAPELDLHRRLSVALPRSHPTLRRKLLTRKHRFMQFYPGTCPMCQIQFHTRIAPSENLPIICERCHQKVLIGELPALTE